MDKNKIELRGAEVIFANLADEGFGKSITIKATDEDIQKSIAEWVKENNIGKGDKAGVPNFKEYEGKKQYSFKINDSTKIVGTNGLSADNLGFGARISLVANAFDYDNKFGKGTSSSLSAVVVEKGADSASDGDLARLLDETVATDKVITSAPLLKDEPLKDITDEVDLSEIPF